MNIWVKEVFFYGKRKRLWLKVLVCSASFVSPLAVLRYFYPSEPQDISSEKYISSRLYLLTFNSHLVPKPFTSPQNKILPLAPIIIHLAFEEADRSVLSLLSFFMHLERYLPFFCLMAPQHPPHFLKIFANKAFRHHHPTFKNSAMTPIHATWFKIVLLSQFLTPFDAKVRLQFIYRLLLYGPKAWCSYISKIW